MKEKMKVNSRFFSLTLRHLEYDNDAAIADIIDNSLETEVNSKNIKVEFTKEKDSKGVRNLISEIRIIDDGCGMTMKTLKEAMALGANTGKNDKTLGKYGAGLKTASLSIGKSLRVLTKIDDGELVMAYLDVDECNNEDELLIDYSTIEEDSKFYKLFHAETGSNHGTIVIIGKLDRLTNRNVYSFADILSKKLRIYFNKFIEAEYCNIFVGGKKLLFYDTIGNKSELNTELLDETSFNINDIEATVKAWYVPLNKASEGTFENCLGRNNKNAGLYIYIGKEDLLGMA